MGEINPPFIIYNMEEAPIKISVVTVCFNAVDAIEETILSVLNQTYRSIEYIIIDGGSTDGTVDIIKKYANKLAYWISEPDKGIYDAMNKGIKVATGEYINFMNAGDSFYGNNVIKNVINLFGNNDFICGIAAIRKKQKQMYLYWKPIKANFKFKDICYGGIINHQSCFIKREILSKGYDLNARIIADELMFIEQVVFNNKTYLPINHIIANYDFYGISNNINVIHQIQSERINFFEKKLPTILLPLKRNISSRIINRIRRNTRFIRRMYNFIVKNCPQLLLNK